MTQRVEILEFLDDIRPRAECDDCLSEELGIRPRQTVNQLCRALVQEQRVTRETARCHRCGEMKLTNAFAMPGALPTLNARPIAAPSHDSCAQSLEPPIDIEKMRTEIVRICRKLWQEAKTEEPPRSLSAVIIALRNDGVIPGHQASMMHTLCNLRNAHVYESIPLGNRELSIAENAYAIIKEWWTAGAR